MFKKSTFILTLLIYLSISNIFSQTDQTYWEVNLGIGSILKHKEVIGHLVRKHPQLYSLSWYKTSPTDENWKKRYNYPDWGITLFHQEFNNPVLGSVTAVNYSTKYYLRDRNKKNQINLGMGIGLAFNTNPLNLETNNQNVAISSAISYALHLKLKYKRPYLLKKIGVHAGLFITHYSNSKFKNPNFGINSIFATAGINYYLDPDETLYPSTPKPKKTKNQPIAYFVSFHTGFHESKPRLGTKPIFFLTFNASKKLSQKSGVSLGFDLINSLAQKEFMYYNYTSEIENKKRKLKDHKQMGVFVGYELLFNKVSVGLLNSYYIYNQYEKSPKFYQRLELRYHFGQSQFYTSLNIKTHLNKADYSTLGIHYQLF